MRTSSPKLTVGNSFCKTVVTNLLTTSFAIVLASSIGCSPFGGDNSGSLLTERPLVFSAPDVQRTKSANDPKFDGEKQQTKTQTNTLTASREPAIDLKTLDRDQLAQRKAMLLEALHASAHDDHPDVVGQSEPQATEGSGKPFASASSKPAKASEVGTPKMITLVATTEHNQTPETTPESDQPQTTKQAEPTNGPLVPMPISAPVVPADNIVAAEKPIEVELRESTAQNAQVEDQTIADQHVEAVVEALEPFDPEVDPQLNSVVRTIPQIHDDRPFKTAAGNIDGTRKLAKNEDSQWLPPNTLDRPIRQASIAKRIACCDSPETCQCEQEYLNADSNEFDSELENEPAVALASFEQPVEPGGDFCPPPHAENIDAFTATEIQDSDGEDFAEVSFVDDTEDLEASPSINEQGRLEVSNGQLCEEISGFGQYQTFANNEFQPGDWALLYIEVANFQSEATAAETPNSNDHGTSDESLVYKTRLRASYTIYDQQGRAVQQQTFPVIEDIAERRRSEFYLHLPIQFPNLPPGAYHLQLEVEDIAAVTAATLEPSIVFVVRQNRLTNK